MTEANEAGRKNFLNWSICKKNIPLDGQTHHQSHSIQIVWCLIYQLSSGSDWLAIEMNIGPDTQAAVLAILQHFFLWSTKDIQYPTQSYHHGLHNCEVWQKHIILHDVTGHFTELPQVAFHTIDQHLTTCIFGSI